MNKKQTGKLEFAGRARSQCVTVLSVVRSAPANPRNEVRHSSVLLDKLEFEKVYVI